MKLAWEKTNNNIGKYMKKQEFDNFDFESDKFNRSVIVSVICFQNCIWSKHYVC